MIQEVAGSTGKPKRSAVKEPQRRVQMPRTLSQSPSAIRARERRADRAANARLDAQRDAHFTTHTQDDPDTIVAPAATTPLEAAAQIAALVGAPVSDRPGITFRSIRTVALRSLPSESLGEGLAIHKKHFVNGAVDAVVSELLANEGLVQVGFQLYDNRTGWLPTRGILTRVNLTVTAELL
jgi:hypothetical protein